MLSMTHCFKLYVNIAFLARTTASSFFNLIHYLFYAELRNSNDIFKTCRHFEKLVFNLFYDYVYTCVFT